MTPLLSILLSALALTVLGFIAWRIQHAFERRERAIDIRDLKADALDVKVAELASQLALLVHDSRNNGGKTSRDQLDAIRRIAEDTNKRTEKIEDKFNDHLIGSQADSTRLNDHLAAVASGALTGERVPHPNA